MVCKVSPTIMDKSLGTLLHFWGVFQFRQVQPLPSPHKRCCVSRIVFRVSTLYRVGERRTARKFRNRCTVLRGNREMTEKYEYCITVPRTFVHDCSCSTFLHMQPTFTVCKNKTIFLGGKGSLRLVRQIIKMKMRDIFCI